MKTFVVSWGFVAVLVGVSGIPRNAAIPMPALCLALVAGLLLYIAVRPAFRDRVLSAGVRTLLAFNLVRFFGLYFVWLSRKGLIAGDVAVLAGWSPVIVALGAIVVLLAFRPQDAVGRQAILVWNIVALLDVVVVFAVMSLMARPGSALQSRFHLFPLSLLPTFFLPLLFVTNVLVFLWWLRGRGPR